MIATDVNRVQLISSAIMFDHIEAGIMSDLNRSQVMVKMILSLQELITELDHKITEGCYSTHDSYLERFPHSGSIGRSQTLQSRRRGLTEVVADSYCEVEEHVPSVAGDSSHLRVLLQKM